MLLTLLERLNRWLDDIDRTRREGYLAISKDIAELERRMKEFDDLWQADAAECSLFGLSGRSRVVGNTTS